MEPRSKGEILERGNGGEIGRDMALLETLVDIRDAFLKLIKMAEESEK